MYLHQSCQVKIEYDLRREDLKTHRSVGMSPLVVVIMLAITSLCMLVFILFVAGTSIFVSLVHSPSTPGFIFVTAGMTPGAVLKIPDALLPMLLGQLA